MDDVFCNHKIYAFGHYHKCRLPSWHDGDHKAGVYPPGFDDGYWLSWDDNQAELFERVRLMELSMIGFPPELAVFEGCINRLVK